MRFDFAIVLALIAGLAGGIQAAVAGEFGKRAGVLEATAVSVTLGAGLVLVLTLTVGNGLSGIVEAFKQPAWLSLAGTIGGFYVITLTYAPPRIGTLATIAVLIVGQLIMAAVIDRLGWFGDPVPLDLGRIVGLVLLIAGALLVLRK